VLISSLDVTKANLVAQFLRARAWWRLDSAGASARHAARSVVSLLDAAAYVHDLPDDDPAIAALAAAGCFRGGAFDPGPEGRTIVRQWQLADEKSGGPADLLADLVQAAARDHPHGHPASPAAPPAAARSVPRQPGPPDEPGRGRAQSGSPATGRGRSRR
jgi:hypothetical protein